MTTDPATAPAEQVPTREEIARKLCRLPGSLCIGFCHRQNCQEAIAVYGDAADAIIALYAPALATAHAEGMRKAAGIAAQIAQRHGSTASDLHLAGAVFASRVAGYAASSVDLVKAAILAAIPKEK